jgi:prophage antirepressor-like protein
MHLTHVQIQKHGNSYPSTNPAFNVVISTFPIPDASGRLQDTTIVSEAGMYDLILQSRKKESLKYRIWVTSDTLPEIYKADNGTARKLTRKLTP